MLYNILQLKYNDHYLGKHAYMQQGPSQNQNKGEILLFSISNQKLLKICLKIFDISLS